MTERNVIGERMNHMRKLIDKLWTSISGRKQARLIEQRYLEPHTPMTSREEIFKKRDQ